MARREKVCRNRNCTVSHPCNSCSIKMQRAQREESQGKWTPGGAVDGQPVKTNQEGNRVEALWGGNNPEGDGPNHGHIVSNDGLNAASVRYPGETEDFFNNPEDKRQR